MGLQGSHLRNEADENSDIDIMVIIDNLTTNDLESYKKRSFLLDILRNHVGLFAENQK